MTQPEPSANKLRILIADDVQETRRATRLMLSLNPRVVVVAIATDGAQAVELAMEHQPDIVILDVNMPQKNGLTAFKEISQMYPETGCIIISTEKQLEVLDTAMNLGVQEYVVKPFTVDELNAAVDRVSENIQQNRNRLATAQRIVQPTENSLENLANEYLLTKRADDKALQVFEELAANPACKIHWLKNLAAIYLLREEWGKLKTLSERLDQLKP